jgi:type III pantothenate kinase
MENAKSPSMLLIDAGNTRVKWAVPASVPEAALTSACAARWLHTGSAERAALAELAQQWAAAAESLNLSRVVISNVAGPGLRDALEALLRQSLGDALRIEWFASQPECAGLRNRYRNPAQLGCDRFAAAIGARALFPAQDLIVATCGTATTVDAVSADGRFLGGMILPGLGTMATSLALTTAQLPQIHEIGALSAPFADNTVDAIVAGCIAAQAGAIERAVATQLALSVKQAGGVAAQVRCVLAGGAGAIVAPYLTLPGAQLEKVDNLVLIGLHTVAMQAD